MICPVCGRENPDDAVTCWRCAIEFAKLLGYDFNEKKENPSTKLNQGCLVVIAIIFLLLVAIVCFLPSFLVVDRNRFTSCEQALAGLKVAEEMYITDHKTYLAGNGASLEKLGMYMISGCTNPKGCGKQVEERIGTPKNPKYCEDFAIKSLNNGLDYQITGTARDRNKCKICVNKKGILPNLYEDCYTNMVMKCP